MKEDYNKGFEFVKKEMLIVDISIANSKAK